ncbi:hypothetical protein ACFWXE_15335 [[Kitasatospora] papulosa]|uniref:hypothetical protein n=1 Tax=[Kitasatospora] papulosa TaxID=1464011 RepID=UPI0036978C90
MTSLFQAAPEWTLTAVPYGSPDARVLVRALHQEQLAGLPPPAPVLAPPTV